MAQVGIRSWFLSCAAWSALALALASALKLDLACLQVCNAEVLMVSLSCKETEMCKSSGTPGEGVRKETLLRELVMVLIGSLVLGINCGGSREDRVRDVLVAELVEGSGLMVVDKIGLELYRAEVV